MVVLLNSRGEILEGDDIIALFLDGRIQVAWLSHFNSARSSLGNMPNKRGEGVARGRKIKRFR